MSKRLMKKIALFEMKKGKAEARAILCGAIGKSERTLLRWLTVGVPTSNDAYVLALACGCSEEEARQIGMGRSSDRARETA